MICSGFEGRNYDDRYDNASCVYGLKRGTVNELCVEDGRNKVIVVFPDENLKTVAADVLAGFAGNGVGTVFIPAVGSEVLVGFLDGNINQPVILGGMYNSKHKPPLEIKPKENTVMFTKFPSNATLEINNDQKQPNIIKLETSNGHKVCIDDDDKKQTIAISSKDGKTLFSIDFKQGKVEIQANQSIEFSVGGKVKLTIDQKGISADGSTGSIKLMAQNLDFDANANINIDAKANLALKANAQLNVEGSAIANVKGGMLKLG